MTIPLYSTGQFKDCICFIQVHLNEYSWGTNRHKRTEGQIWWICLYWKVGALRTFKYVVFDSNLWQLGLMKDWHGEIALPFFIWQMLWHPWPATLENHWKGLKAVYEKLCRYLLHVVLQVFCSTYIKLRIHKSGYWGFYLRTWTLVPELSSPRILARCQSVPGKNTEPQNLGAFGSSLCSWILDFLTGRPQQVRVRRSTSSSIILKPGTPVFWVQYCSHFSLIIDYWLQWRYNSCWAEHWQWSNSLQAWRGIPDGVVWEQQPGP